MLDINLLRSELDAVVTRLAVKRFNFDKELFIGLDEQRNTLLI